LDPSNSVRLSDAFWRALLGQFGIAIPGVLSTTFFLLFLFAVGYKTGPQFFRVLGHNALPQVILTVLFAVSGLVTTYSVARVLRFDAGTAVGLISGALHSTQVVGTGSDAIGKLALQENVRHTLTANIAVDSFSPERVFVERVKKNNQGVTDADPGFRILAGDLIVLSGRSKMLAGSNNPLHPYEVEEPELLDVPAIAVDHSLERKDMRHRTLSEIVETLGGEIATKGVYVRKVLRAG
jgi:uncharacterized transporter YbjL